jgi:adenylate cyclase, class 2
MSTEAPIETEIKLAVQDPTSAAALLVRHGFTIRKERVFESNVIFDTASRDLRSAGCALRVRTAGSAAILTFKGPAERTRHKSREEIETELGDAAAASRILGHLGYHPAFRYEKYRTEFARTGDPGLVTLDETPIGCFLELEGEAEWIDKTANALGFSEKDYVTSSYTALYVCQCNARGIAPTNMVFQATSYNS